jgi:pectinesterase
MESDSKMKIKYIVSILALVVVSFITKAQVKYDFVVAKDGTGTFKTVQEAINAVPDFRKNQTTIFIKNGVYKEKLILATSKTNVKFVGEDAMKTIITNDDFAQRKNRFGEEMGTTGSSTFFVFGDDFSAENITFENSAGPVGQAVAVRIDGDRVTFNKCRFLGNQDTLYPHGEKSRQYYKDCYIEGTVDFIFGWSTAVFDNCTVFCKNSGYVTAASTLDTVRYGFVFINCKITGDAPANSFYLGRPWRPFAKTVFINCYLDKQIKPEGWHNWDKKDAESTSFYAEYKSKGPGANDKARVNWSHQLSDEEAKAFTLENIFRDWKVGDGKHK